ncbi:ATP-dependent RNA helicase ddx3x [Mortierella sp. NVP41]|nr:ATP-dependent RNA helicase ddx3x [Mortierella sp. NVP41]
MDDEFTEQQPTEQQHTAEEQQPQQQAEKVGLWGFPEPLDLTAPIKWGHSRPVYQWQERYTDETAPANSELENELFGEENRTNRGIHFNKYRSINVSVKSGPVNRLFINGFKELALHPKILENIKRLKYDEPTPIQRHATPLLFAGYDVLGCAQTGSGKTAAFLVTILSQLLSKMSMAGAQNQPRARRNKASPLALIILPARELGIQMFDSARGSTYKSRLRPAVIYGGANLTIQNEDLRKGGDIPTATPGRLIDAYEQDLVSLSKVKYVVIDEADRILGMDFEPKILHIMTATDMPKDESLLTALFSATFPSSVQVLARKTEQCAEDWDLDVTQVEEMYVKDEIEIRSRALEDIRTEMSAVEDRHSNELRYQGDLAKEAHEKYERELMLERCKSQAESAASNLKSAEIAWESQKLTLQRPLKTQNEKPHRNLEDVNAQALSIQQSASAQVSFAESREGASSVEGEDVGKKSTEHQVVKLYDINGYVRCEEILGCRQDSNLQESLRLEQQLDQTNKTFEEARPLLSETCYLQQKAVVPKEPRERLTEKTSQLCFSRGNNTLLRAENQKLLRQDSSLEKNGHCFQVDLSPLSVRVKKVETETELRKEGQKRFGEDRYLRARTEDTMAKHTCIDPTEFQELKDANQHYRIEAAENVTVMTALKMEHESLRDRLEVLETKFNKLNALDVSVARVFAQHSQPIWGATSETDSASQGGAHPMMMTASGVSGTGYPTQLYLVMMPPYYPQGYPPQSTFFQRPVLPPVYAFPGGDMAPYGYISISPVDAHGSPEPLVKWV